MTDGNNRSESGPPPDRCGLRVADTSGVVRVGLSPAPSPRDYREAMRLAAAEASRRLGEGRFLFFYLPLDPELAG